MKKIPTLFERQFENHKVVGITGKVTPGMEWVLEGEGVATVKIDGSCTAIIDGELYRRYDAKKGKKPPEGAIPCCDPDPVTGHWPHWIKVDWEACADKWYREAYLNSSSFELKNGTYEAIGPHFQGNPYGEAFDYLIPHGCFPIMDLSGPRTFESIKTYLENHEIEGIVFWRNGFPECKIKRSDFGYEWPVNGASLL